MDMENSCMNLEKTTIMIMVATVLRIRGDEYGPYQIAPYSTGIKGRYTKIYFTMSTWNPYQVVQMSAIITSKEEEEQEDPKPYATDMRDRNDRKYAYVSVLLAHLAKIKEIDLRNSIQSSTYIADHIEWAQFHSTDELRAEIKDKFLQLISGLASDADKAEVYSTMTVAFSKLSYDYHNSTTFKDNLEQTNHRRWALDAIHSGHNDWLISQINRAADYEHFLLSSNDCLCYAYGPQDSNEFKYARLNVLLSNLANKTGVKGRNSHSYGRPPFDCNAYIAWARFRPVKEIRDDLLNKILQIICKSSSDEFVAFAYDEIAKVIVKLTDGDHQTASYNEDCSSAYEWALSMASKRKKEEIIIRITKLIESDYFLIPIGLITRREIYSST
jgi:hypothetical protein